MEMLYGIACEYGKFLKNINDSGFVSGIYMDESEYEEEYSHNAINEAMGKMQKKIRDYLHKNRPGEFIVLSDWCVHVLTIDRAKQLNISDRTIKLRLVK